MQQTYVLFFHLRPLPLPIVPEEERYYIRRAKIPNTFRIIVRHGYNDRIISKDLATILFNRLRSFIIQEHAAKPGLVSQDGDRTIVPPAVDNVVAGEIQALTKSLRRAGSVHRRQRPIEDFGCCKLFQEFVLSVFLWIRENTRNKIAELDIPVDELVEIGYIRDYSIVQFVRPWSTPGIVERIEFSPSQDNMQLLSLEFSHLSTRRFW
ncbi:hypothetical protein V1527DRAFT_485860 [Lipomyces starkeyi]